MPGVFLFDLDMTLVDSSALAQMRRFQMWDNVRQNMHLCWFPRRTEPVRRIISIEN